MEPCIEAPGHRTKDGYVRKRRRGVRKMAHVWAWEDKHGPVPPGMHVLHRCDNPPCRNTDHLFLGTIADNNADRHRKGRTVVPDQRGEKHSQARLTDDAVRAIRDAVKLGETQASVARRYGVDPSTVSLVSSGRRWSHV